MGSVLGGWGEFIFAYLVFFASHMVPARPGMRRALVLVLGEKSYLWAYSLASVAILTWLVIAAGRAPFVGLWPFSPWQMWAPNLVMPLVCILLVVGVFTVNPFSFFGVRPEQFDPDHPGIAGAMRHPALWAIAIWAGAHMVPNANLAHFLLFGMFVGFAFLGMVMIDRRKRRQLGAQKWAEQTANTSFWPFEALIAGRWRPQLRSFPFARMTFGAGLYLVLVLVHEYVIGVSPWPVL